MAKFALLIGISDYGIGFNSIPGAAEDIEAMQRVLRSPTGDFDDIETLINPDPLTMQGAIETLFKDKARHSNDLVLLYFSGHCIKDNSNKLHLATQMTSKNPQGELVKSTAVSASFVQDIMNDSRAQQQVVILDCCFHKTGVHGAFVSEYAALDIENQLGGNRVVLTSSTSMQYHAQHKGSAVSTYTRYLVEGIATGAADLDGDRAIAVDELHAYISRQAEAAAATIEPEIHGSAANRQIVLASVPDLQPQVVATQPVTRRTPRGTLRTQNRRNARKVVLGVSLSAIALIGGTYALQQLQFQPLSVGQRLVAAPRDYSETAQTRRDHSKTIWSLATTNDGRTLASSSGDAMIKIWDLPSGKVLRTLAGHTESVWSVAISPDRQTLVSGSSDQTIKVWNLQTGQLTRTLPALQGTVWAVIISQDGETLVSADDSNTVSVWNLHGQLLHSFRGTTPIRTIALSPDAQTLASGGKGGNISVWDVSSGKLVRSLPAQKSKIITLAIGPDGETLVSGSNDKTVEVWNFRTGKLLRVLHGHTDHVNSVAISADGQFLVSGAEDHTIKLWSLRNGKLLHTFAGHSEDVYAVAISPDDQTVISGDKGGEIKFWR